MSVIEKCNNYRQKPCMNANFFSIVSALARGGGVLGVAGELTTFLAQCGAVMARYGPSVQEQGKLH